MKMNCMFWNSKKFTLELRILDNNLVGRIPHPRKKKEVNSASGADGGATQSIKTKPKPALWVIADYMQSFAQRPSSAELKYLSKGGDLAVT